MIVSITVVYQHTNTSIHKNHLKTKSISFTKKLISLNPAIYWIFPQIQCTVLFNTNLIWEISDSLQYTYIDQSNWILMTKYTIKYMNSVKKEMYLCTYNQQTVFNFTWWFIQSHVHVTSFFGRETQYYLVHTLPCISNVSYQANMCWPCLQKPDKLVTTFYFLFQSKWYVKCPL